MHAPGDRPGTKHAPAEGESLESALGRKWLLAAGVVALVFGVGYFLKYTFAQGWIGPPGQLLLAYAFGALLLGGGEWTRRRGYAPFGLWVLGGGLASFYFATFAGHRLFELLPSMPALAAFVVTTIAAVTLAVLHGAPGLAVLGLLGGYLTPFVLEGMDDTTTFLFVYVSLLNAGVLAATWYRRWNGLNWLGLVASFLVFGFWLMETYLPFSLWSSARGVFWTTLLFSNVNFLAFCVVPLVGALYGAKCRPRQGPAASPGPVGLVSRAWLGGVASYMALALSCPLIADRHGEESAALPILLYAGAFAALAWLAASRREHAAQEEGEPQHLALLRAHAGFYFLLAATVGLSGQWITTALALQGALLVLVGLRLHGRGLNLLGQAASMLALARLLVVDYSDAWGLVTHTGLSELQGALYTFYGGYADMLPQRLLVEVAVLGSLGLSAWFAGPESGKRAPGAAPRDWGRLLRLVFSTGLLAVLSVECGALFGELVPAARSAAVSALWALFATGLVYYGFRQDRRGARIGALGLYGATLFKVVLVDMEAFATPYRIISFLALGGLLVGGSFLYHRNLKSKPRQDPAS